MIGDRIGGGGAGGGGVSSSQLASMLAGYATEQWVGENYLSIAFFNRLFKAYGGETEVKPNDTETTIDNIEAMFGFWTEQYVSALGKGSGGSGGGGGASALSDLVDVQTGTLSDGDALVWNESVGRWVNGKGGGSVVSVGMTVPAGFTVSGSPVTGSGTLALGFSDGYSLPTTAKQDKWDEAYEARHTHSNKGLLDGITLRMVSNWTTAYNNSHTHDNKKVLDGITSINVYNWQNAYLWGNHADAGYATQTWTQLNFLSIDFFRRLFRAYTDRDIEVKPNDKETTIDNIKAMFGFWTEQYVSALGRGSGGSEGGDATVLSDLVDVQLGTLHDGDALVWDDDLGKWVNGKAATGSVTSVGMTVPAGFTVSGSPVTSSGTLALRFASGYSLPTTAKQDSWDEAYAASHTHANKSLLDGLGETDIDHWNEAYEARHTHANKSVLDAITQARATQWDTAYSWGDHTSAGYLKTATGTFWGQSWSNGKAVSGNIDSGSLGGKVIGFHSFELNSYGTQQAYGGYIDFHFGGSSADYTTRIIETASGVLSIRALGTATGLRAGIGTDGDYLQIGNIRITYDQANNALAVSKADGTAANFYALGGVSALGYGAGGSGGGASALSDLVDVQTGTLSDGDALVWDGDLGKWVNGKASTGTVTSVGMTVPTGFSVSGSPVTSSGTLALKFASGYSLPTITEQDRWDEAYAARHTHANKSVLDAITQARVSAWDEAYAARHTHANKSVIDAITQAKVTQWDTAYSWGNHASEGYLKTATGTFWGKAWENGGTVSGSIDAGAGGGTVNGFHAIELNSRGTLANFGGFIDFHYNGSSSDYTTRIIEDAAGVLRVTAMTAPTGLAVGNGQAGEYVQIGQIRMVYDKANNAIAFQKADGTAANVYATGGISALGFTTGTGTVDSMTFNHLTVNDSLTLKGNLTTADKDIDAGKGAVRASRFYLDDTRYIFLSGSALMYYNGTATKTIKLE